MADNDVTFQNVENSESSENMPDDEWTIIHESCSEKEETGDGDPSADGINGNQGSSRHIEIIATSNNGAINDETGTVIVEQHAEDSDGISVITESEAEQLVINKKFSEIDSSKNHAMDALKLYEKTEEKTIPQVGTILNVVIACSLAAMIGLGAGRILGMDDKCPVTSAVDFMTIRTESDKLINQIKELSEVKDVLYEIKAGIPQMNRAQEKIPQSGSKSWSKRFTGQERPWKISDIYIFHPDTTILEQLRTSLNTLCSVINGITPESHFIQSDVLRTQGVVEDLIELKKIIHTMIKELEDTSGSKEIQFLRYAEKRIRHVCESLLSDLSYTIHGVTMRIHHKLNKVRHKLNKQMCLLKNVESTDEGIFKSLEENSFLESCDKILTVTLKRSSQSAKIDKKTNFNAKSSSKPSNLEKSSTKKSTSKSEDARYSRDSSTDSSVPDLTYNSNDYDFWKKKQILRQEGKEARCKSGKIPIENDLKCGTVKNAKSAKSRRARSLRKLMMEVLVPAQSCVLTQKHCLQSDFNSDHPETQRLEQPIFNDKPLYSAVLKSTTNFTSSVESDLIDEKSSRKQVIENTQTYVTAKAIKQMDKDFRMQDVKSTEDVTETKHNITPAETDMKAQIIKSMKEQWNTNTRQPIQKYKGLSRDEETLQSEEISTKKHEDPQQLANIEKVPSSARSLKHCRKGKKCSSNESTYETIPSDSGNNKYKKSNNEKTVNKRPAKIRDDDDRKNPKETKQNEIISSTSKITDTKMKRSFKKRNDKQKMNDQLVGDWQLKRSRAREMHRDRDHRSEWFFDRAHSRQDARKDINEIRNAKFKTGTCCDPPCKSYPRDKCEPIFEEQIHEKFYDFWDEAKNPNSQKHSNSRAGFTAKNKMPHRKNIMQSKRY